MSKYRVHLYLEVRYPVEVEADSPEEAAKKAINQDQGLYNLCRYTEGEYAEDIHGILVDLLDKEGNLVEKSYDFDVDDILEGIDRI